MDDQAISDTFLYYFGEQSDTKHFPGPNKTASSVKTPLPKPHPTIAVNDVVRHWDDFQPETRKKLSGNIQLTDPDDSGARQVMAYENGICLETMSEETSLTRDSAHFRVVFKTEGDGATTSDYVDNVLSYAEHVYDTITSMGFTPALTPPDGLLRIYICEIYDTFGYYGLTWPDEIFEAIDTARTHLEIDDDYENIVFENGMNVTTLLQSTIAHEFFHATQFAISYSPPSWFLMESTAVWMEAHVYPDINGYITEYLIDRFTNIHEPIDYWSMEDTIGYGDAILFQYITEHVDDDSFILDLWTTMRATCTAGNPPGWCVDTVKELPLLETLLGNLGTNLSNTYADCVAAMFLKDFEDGGLSYYPAVGQRILGSSASGELDHLGSLFYRVDLCSDQVPKQLDLTLNGSGGDIWKLTLFKKNDDGSYATETVALTDGDGAKSILGYCSTYKTVTMLVSNINTSADARSLSVTADVQDMPAEPFTHDFGPGWHMVGTPIQPFISDPVQSLDVGLRILARFKLGRYITNGEHDPTAAGQAFWLRFENTTNTVSVLGNESATDTVAITKGWNMLSLPFNSAAPWDQTIEVVTTGGTYALGSAQADAFVQPILYSWDASANGWATPAAITDDFTIQPWDGFAVKALQDCSLKFPKP